MSRTIVVLSTGRFLLYVNYGFLVYVSEDLEKQADTCWSARAWREPMRRPVVLLLASQLGQPVAGALRGARDNESSPAFSLPCARIPAGDQGILARRSPRSWHLHGRLHGHKRKQRAARFRARSRRSTMRRIVLVLRPRRHALVRHPSWNALSMPVPCCAHARCAWTRCAWTRCAWTLCAWSHRV